MLIWIMTADEAIQLKEAISAALALADAAGDDLIAALLQHALDKIPVH